MADQPLDERRFSDEEVREILRRAVEQASSSNALTRRDGLTLAELKEVAAEVGIDPARLDQAARSLVLRDADEGGRLLGGPRVVHLERSVTAAFRPEETPEVLSVIRRTMGTQGEVDEIHGSLEWSARGDAAERYVTLSPRDGGTAIRGSVNLSNAAVLTYLPAGLLGAITSLAGLIKYVQDGSVVGGILFLAVLPILYPILRTVYGRIARSEAQRLERTVEALARLPEEGEVQP
jgi:hypothetical protein